MATSRRKAGFAVYFQDLPAETLSYLVEAHCQTPTEFKRPISLPCQCCRTQNWCLTDLRDIDRQAWKIVCESGGKHPLGLKVTVYLPRALGGRGMRSVEEEYKMTKIKSAIKLYSNEDPVTLNL